MKVLQTGHKNWHNCSQVQVWKSADLCNFTQIIAESSTRNKLYHNASRN